MFLKKCMQENPELIDFAFKALKSAAILPDTYLLDLDQITENAQKILVTAKENGIKLYFMLKQIGRNPLVAHTLQTLGYDGCVAVDYREALLMIEQGIHLGNVGHLVQIPQAALAKIIAAKPDVITVYSLEKIKEIDAAAAELGLVQPLLIRITDADAQLYSGQIAGFKSAELPQILALIKSLKHVRLGGLTCFPALLYNDESGKIETTENIKGIKRALAYLPESLPSDFLINLPSVTCCAALPLIKALGGNNGEPGHSLTGTTPLHRASVQEEKPAYLYASEISHNYEDKAYCYGGGYYRRGHLEFALVEEKDGRKLYKAQAPQVDSIDYHLEIEANCSVGAPVVFCFRTQIFTTRSQVAVISGLHHGQGQIVGLYNSLGQKMEKDWE